MSELELLSVERIWDRGAHNAFTGLTRWDGRWWCTFREARGHVSDDGALRVIVSEDGSAWESAALISIDGRDLRDPKLNVTPDCTLMLLAGERHQEDGEWRNASMTWHSPDGERWHGPFSVADPGTWLWRATWHAGTAWGFAYGCQPQGCLRLFRSRCGMRFEQVGDDIVVGTYPNETSIVFDGDTALCLLRLDGEGATGRLGRARPPYTEWEWRDLGVKIGGPEMIRLPDSRYLACCRLYDDHVRTSLLWLDPAEATLTEALELPSGGDTSYAGMTWHEGLLWVAYYSSHGEKTSIYLAKVRVP
ncbi:MAG: exo-alpha-sialidase [Armatimonadota bacterium]